MRKERSLKKLLPSLKSLPPSLTRPEYLIPKIKREKLLKREKTRELTRY